MEPAELIVHGTATLASIAAIGAVAIDRFQKKLAGNIVLAAGAVPWGFFIMWNSWLQKLTFLFVISMFGSGPLFLIAFFLYGLGARTPKRGVAAGLSLFGIFVGVGFSVSLFRLLCMME